MVTSLQDELASIKGEIQVKEDKILELKEDVKEAVMELAHFHKRLAAADAEAKVINYYPIKYPFLSGYLLL